MGTLNPSDVIDCWCLGRMTSGTSLKSFACNIFAHSHLTEHFSYTLNAVLRGWLGLLFKPIWSSTLAVNCTSPAVPLPSTPTVSNSWRRPPQPAPFSTPFPAQSLLFQIVQVKVIVTSGKKRDFWGNAFPARVVCSMRKLPWSTLLTRAALPQRIRPSIHRPFSTMSHPQEETPSSSQETPQIPATSDATLTKTAGNGHIPDLFISFPPLLITGSSQQPRTLQSVQKRLPSSPRKYPPRPLRIPPLHQRQ